MLRILRLPKTSNKTATVTTDVITGITEGMIKPINISAIEAATNRPWQQWVQLLEEAGAGQMNHSQIAVLALELMPADVKQKEWWAQGTAVAFEQHAGLRVPGQACRQRICWAAAFQARFCRETIATGVLFGKTC